MEELKNVVAVWLSMLVLIQSVVFMFSSSDGRSFVNSYAAACAKTLRVLVRFFVPGRTIEERKAAMAIWAVVALCVPGAIMITDIVGRMAR
jgi:hypothetical protein